ncbi:MAG: asparagine synthase-related protein [Candidatus Ozemobacteraceae bacterium]
MGTIFGIVDFTGKPIDPRHMESAKSRVQAFTPDISHSNGGNCWFFGHSDFFSSPESRFEKMPLYDPDSGIALVAAARLDNRLPLLERFSVPCDERPETPDGKLVFLAYHEWGDEAPKHLRGDWSFAAWNERTHSLFVARDQIGNTGVFFFFKDGIFAFSSISPLIFDLTGLPRRLNEAKLAQHLVIFPGNPGETIWQDIFSLYPGCFLQARRDDLQRKKYWSIQEVPPLRLSSEIEYQEAFRRTFRSAVGRRMKSRGLTATQLSCGLDSSSVTAFAAEFARESNEHIISFTSIPAYPAEHFFPGSITDEWPIAHSVAVKYRNVTHIPIQAKDLSPIRALHLTVETLQMPMHAAVNAYWIFAVQQEARRLGVKTMLTGQLGNGGISWSGGANRIYDLFYTGRWKTAFRELREVRLNNILGWNTVIRRHLLRPLFKPLLNHAKHVLMGSECSLQSYAAIHPDFAQSIGVAERIRSTGRGVFFSPPPSPAVEREKTLMANAAMAGPIYHQGNAEGPLQTLDPTVDLDLLELCLAVPEKLFTADGGERMFLRKSMEGLLPSEVQWNHRRGKQAADITLRLINASEDVEEELARLSRSSSVNAYLSIPAMAQAWKKIQDHGANSSENGAISLLMRGIQTGIFLERFFG